MLPLLDGVARKGVLGLQVEDVELVDARRHEQQRALVDLCRGRLVFDELEELVFKNHRALGDGEVLADFKLAFVRHGHMPLTQVVEHVGHALGEAFAMRLDGFFLRLGVEGEKVAGRGRRHPLVHGKAQARLGLGITFSEFGHRLEGALVEQIHGGGERRHRVLAPSVALEAAVFQLGALVQALVPEFRGLLDVVALQVHHLARVKAQLRQLHRWRGARRGALRVQPLLHGAQPVLALLHPCGHARRLVQHLLPHLCRLICAHCFSLDIARNPAASIPCSGEKARL